MIDGVTMKPKINPLDVCSILLEHIHKSAAEMSQSERAFFLTKPPFVRIRIDHERARGVSSHCCDTRGVQPSGAVRAGRSDFRWNGSLMSLATEASRSMHTDRQFPSGPFANPSIFRRIYSRARTAVTTMIIRPKTVCSFRKSSWLKSPTFESTSRYRLDLCETLL